MQGISRDVLETALNVLPLCPLNRFVNLTKLDMLKGKVPKNSKLCVTAFRCEETVAKTAPLSIDDEPLKVSILNLYSAKSSGLFFGYVFAVYAPVNFNDNYISMTAVKESQYNETALSFQDKYISVVNNPDGACVVISNVVKLFDTTIIRLRRTKQ